VNRPVPLVELVRSGLREGLHHGSVVVLDADRSVRHASGETDAPMYPRSALKPAQAVGMLRAGLELPDPDIALAAASHSGEDEHVARARESCCGTG
jgi:L-asparaginase II